MVARETYRARVSGDVGDHPDANSLCGHRHCQQHQAHGNKRAILPPPRGHQGVLIRTDCRGHPFCSVRLVPDLKSEQEREQPTSNRTLFGARCAVSSRVSCAVLRNENETDYISSVLVGRCVRAPSFCGRSGEISRSDTRISQGHPRPTFEIPESSAGRTLAVRFKTREYDLRIRIKSGEMSDRSVKREGPSEDGFFLRAHILPLGEVNQAAVPQTLREQYWSTFVAVYPAETAGKQIYLALSYGRGTDEKIINTMKRIAEQIARGDSTNRADAVRGSPQQ
jgi:hypothetical protein